MAHFELVERLAPNAVIKVIGVGGGGGNAVAHMVNAGVDGVEFITANTDSQAIKQSGAKQQLQLGGNVTKGLGASPAARHIRGRARRQRRPATPAAPCSHRGTP
jgi:cell division protein FtsZ